MQGIEWGCVLSLFCEGIDGGELLFAARQMWRFEMRDEDESWREAWAVEARSPMNYRISHSSPHTLEE